MTVAKPLRRQEYHCQKMTDKSFGKPSCVCHLPNPASKSAGRYLIEITDGNEHIPFFADLKTGYCRKYLSSETNKRVASMLEPALENAMSNSPEHTEENPKTK